ncbi:MAG: ribosome rescue GTPase HflX [Gammaproteobacteria bacterium]
MIERSNGGERATLVHIDFSHAHAGPNGRDFTEFRELVDSTGVETAAVIIGTRKAPDPKYFVGSGKAEEIRNQSAAARAGVAIFDHALSPSQERNLEKLCGCRVLDRTGLILDIFARRARSFEGKLQVELAQLNHMSTRLVRGWSHLERQRGGIGLRGPGETQLETDRRLIGARIKQIHKRLDKVRKRREQGRRARKKAAVPTVSLVGYTNAGKSTLFNQLTQAAVLAADRLFATLDPTLRRVDIGYGSGVVLVDTVGFLRDLPHDLIDAFHATLQETREADLLVHVVDAGDPQREFHVEQVNRVLSEIGADDVPQILVYNKIDALGVAPRVECRPDQRLMRVWLSAATGAGTDLLRGLLREALQSETVRGWLNLPPQAGRARSRLFAMGAVLQEQVDERGTSHLRVQMPRRQFEVFARREGLPARMSRD